MRVKTVRYATYSATQMVPPGWKNFGGIKTDIRRRVLGKFFEPIKGLAATGEFAGTAGGGGFVVRANRG